LDRGFAILKRPIVVLLAVLDPLAVGAVGDPRLGGPVPYVPTGRPGRVIHVALRGVSEPLLRAAAIAQRPVLLDEIRPVRPHRPPVPVGGYFPVHVEVVEKDELPGELVVVRRDRLREEAELGLAVPLGHVAEYLVVCPILLDDVDHVLDRGLLAWVARDRIVL